MIKAKFPSKEARIGLCLRKVLLLADTSIKVVLEMLFFLLSDANMGKQQGCLEMLTNAMAICLGRHSRVYVR